MAEMGELMERLKREATEGGELVDLPCPFCKRPRSRRSDYVRCAPCGTNWLDGEDLSRDPRIDRKAKIFPTTVTASSMSATEGKDASIAK